MYRAVGSSRKLILIRGLKFKHIQLFFNREVLKDLYNVNESIEHISINAKGSIGPAETLTKQAGKVLLEFYNRSRLEYLAR